MRTAGLAGRARERPRQTLDDCLQTHTQTTVGRHLGSLGPSKLLKRVIRASPCRSSSGPDPAHQTAPAARHSQQRRPRWWPTICCWPCTARRRTRWTSRRPSSSSSRPRTATARPTTPRTTWPTCSSCATTCRGSRAPCRRCATRWPSASARRLAGSALWPAVLRARCRGRACVRRAPARGAPAGLRCSARGRGAHVAVHAAWGRARVPWAPARRAPALLRAWGPGRIVVGDRLARPAQCPRRALAERGAPSTAWPRPRRAPRRGAQTRRPGAQVLPRAEPDGDALPGGRRR